jgi:hypothetical protein
MIHFLFYISESLLSLIEQEKQVEAIVSWSHGWNPAFGITGALVFTQQHFVQFIEGPQVAIDDLIARIRRDSRHRNVNVMLEGESEVRRFENWSLAYHGPELFLADKIEALVRSVDPETATRSAEELVLLMQAFTASDRHT